jgi:hypothetical protein
VDPCPPGLQRRITGNIELPTVAWATVEGADESRFGFTVTGVGDVTGDGRDDVLGTTLEGDFGIGQAGPWLVSSPLAPGWSALSAAGIQLVDIKPLPGADYWLTPHHNAVQPLDDLNGDGLPELALGAYSAYAAGAVYLVASPISAPPGTPFPIDPSYGRIVTGVAGKFGYSIAAADVDADGVQDLLASAPGTYDADGWIRGQVHVFLGPIPPGPSDPGDASFRIFGDNPAPVTLGGPIAMGEQVVVGDLTGDGLVEVVVTSPAAYVGGAAFAGEAYIFEGPLVADTPTSDATATVQGREPWDGFGFVAAYLGDTDGDGYGDLGLGSIGGWDDEGHTWILDGPVAGTATAEARADTHFSGPAPFEKACEIAPAGDLDQDGLADVAIGSVSATYLYYGALPTGSHALDELADAMLTDPINFESWPAMAAAAGDIDGDCMPDLAVGAWGPGPGASKVYILQGGTF